MPREYDEKRDFMRVSVDCLIEYIPDNTLEERNGTVKNLSGRGMMFPARAGRRCPLPPAS